MMRSAAALVLTLGLLLGCGGGASSSGVPFSGAVPAGTASPLGPPALGSGAQLGGCTIFPADNPWNQDISGLPVDQNSAAYLASMNAGTRSLHPDFGSDPTYGIPFIIVPASQPPVPVSFDYASESDPGPYPIPANAPLEGGPAATGDRHILVLQSGTCQLYELFSASYTNPGWHAGSGARFDLNSDALRPDYWTSADAAGLPILPGLARYDEVQSGVISHALRFTVHATQAGFIHPATHMASISTNSALPPMGLRVRLKAAFPLAGFSGNSLVILTALKKYGMFVADNGSDWYISGSTDTRWSDADLNQMKTVPASAFEVVQAGTIIH
ncbi:MAG: hypothetical protein NVSMB31_09240 [Vulcanimicrobiaceae bacterium]